MPPAARRLAALLWILAALGLSCSPSGHRRGWDGQADRAETSDLVRFLQARDEVENAWESKEVGRLGKVSSDDVVFVPPGETVAVGKEAALEWFRESARGPERSDTYVSESVDLVGEWAVERWSIMRRLCREKVRWWERMKGMHVYRRRQDGRWLLVYRIWNSSPLYGEATATEARGLR